MMVWEMRIATVAVGKTVFMCGGAHTKKPHSHKHPIPPCHNYKRCVFVVMYLFITTLPRAHITRQNDNHTITVGSCKQGHLHECYTGFHQPVPAYELVLHPPVCPTKTRYKIQENKNLCKCTRFQTHIFYSDNSLHASPCCSLMQNMPQDSSDARRVCLVLQPSKKPHQKVQKRTTRLHDWL